MSQIAIAGDVLSILGFHVDVIDDPARVANDEKIADYRISINGVGAVVEEKTKIDGPEQTTAREELLSIGAVYVSEPRLIRPNNTISGVLKNAAQQLSSVATAATEDEIRLVFYTATGVNAQAKYEQFLATVYGSAGFYGRDKKYRTCYFYRYSDFIRRADRIDGAFVCIYRDGMIDGLVMCLNPYSPRYLRLRSSAFVLPFEAAIKDPFVEEEAGKAYLLPGELLSASDEEKENYIREKYCVRDIWRIDFQQYELSVRT